MVAACPFPAPRGTPTRILRLAEGVANYGHSVHVVAYHLGDSMPVDQFTLHRIENVSRYQRLEAGPSYFKLWVDWKLSRKIRKLQAELEFDVIHAHHYEGLLAALLGNTRHDTPIIYDAHTLAGVELVDYRLGLPAAPKRWIGHQIDRHMPGRACFCVTASQNLQEELVAIGAVPVDRIITIANGVESNHFSKVRLETVTRDRKQLIFTGNLAPYQGIDILVDMFSTLCQRRDDVDLLFLTDDPVDELRESFAQRGLAKRVVFEESQFQELPRRLAAADVALNPRIRCDGVPQKLLNYMAAGCPIVSFSGSAQHLTNGESALLVDEPDSESFMTAVNRLLDEPKLAATLGRNAREIAVRDLSWELGSADLIDSYLKILNK